MAKLLYEGKAKQVYEGQNENEYIIHYKDDATAGNGVKHDQFEGKGVLNNTISCIIFDMLEEAGIYGLSDPNGDNMAQKAGAAYHDKNDGYMPKAGDIIEWGGHVGIYDGSGGYIASNTKTGIHHGSMEEAEDWFGPVEGYISTAQYTVCYQDSFIRTHCQCFTKHISSFGKSHGNYSNFCAIFIFQS